MAELKNSVDGHTVKKLVEEMETDAVGGIGKNGDDSFGFVTSTPIDMDASKGRKGGEEMEFFVDGTHRNSVDEALGAVDVKVGLLREDGVDEDIKDGHAEFDIDGPHSDGDEEALGAADAKEELPSVEGLDAEIPNVVGVPMQRRIGWMEVQLEKVKVDIGQIKSRMIDLIHTQNGMLEHRVVNEERNVVSTVEFEKMVDEAVKSAAKYGASRKYITRFLVVEKSQQDSRYFQKKLGMILKKKLMKNEYVLVDSLYSINKN